MSLAIATGSVSAEAAIAAALEAVWTGEGLDADYIFYDDTTNQSAANVKWMRVTVEFGSSIPSSWGGSGATNVRTGLILLQIFGPTNKGGGDIKALADSISAALTRQTAGDVRFSNYTTGEGPRGPGRVIKGSWAGRRLDVPFHYWEVL